MALTAWEGIKVAGNVLQKLGAKADEFETNNPEKKYTPGVNDIVELVVETLKEVGAEMAD